MVFDQGHLVPVLRFAVHGFGQDHDRRFQTLGAVDRHHPDALAFAVHLALDGHLIGGEPDQEAGQAGHLQPFIGHRL